MEGPRTPCRDGERQHEGEPLPAGELDGGDHRERHDGDREREADPEPTRKAARGVIAGLLALLVRLTLGCCSSRIGCDAGVIASLLDGSDGPLSILFSEPGSTLDCAHFGPFEREVHTRLEPLELIEGALDAVRAGSTRHALEIEGEVGFRRV